MIKDKKKLAINLRLRAKTYAEIIAFLHVPKSTLSYWLKGIRIPKEIRTKVLANARQSWAKSITEYNKRKATLARQRWQERAFKARKEIGRLTLRELKLVGTALYWAEGYKKTYWTIVFCNSDPRMIALMMRFFRQICKVSSTKIKANVQVHDNVSEKSALDYWSKISGVPLANFRKTLRQTPKSSKHIRPANTLPYGTFRIIISDVKLVNKIKGWIEGIAP